MDVSVLRVRHGAIGIRLAEVADDRPRASRRYTCGFLVVAHERRDVVTGAHERLEHCTADVSGCTGEEDSHTEALQLTLFTFSRGPTPARGCPRVRGALCACARWHGRRRHLLSRGKHFLMPWGPTPTSGSRLPPLANAPHALRALRLRPLAWPQALEPPKSGDTS